MWSEERGKRRKRGMTVDYSRRIILFISFAGILGSSQHSNEQQTLREGKHEIKSRVDSSRKNRQERFAHLQNRWAPYVGHEGTLSVIRIIRPHCTRPTWRFPLRSLRL